MHHMPLGAYCRIASELGDQIPGVTPLNRAHRRWFGANSGPRQINFIQNDVSDAYWLVSGTMAGKGCVFLIWLETRVRRPGHYDRYWASIKRQLIAHNHCQNHESLIAYSLRNIVGTYIITRHIESRSNRVAGQKCARHGYSAFSRSGQARRICLA
jgi:hypothetical protein